MGTADSDYYRRRADQERIRAELAKDPKARLAHSELADRYEGIVQPTMTAQA